jgi:hypothetical protein
VGVLKVEDKVTCTYRIMIVKGIVMNKISIKSMWFMGSGNWDVPYALYESKRESAI